MFPYVRAQWFIDTAYVSDLFQITVHPLVTGYRQDHSFFQAFRMCLVLLQNHPWNVQQWNVTHVVRLFPGFSYPVLAIDILYYVFISQVLYIGKGQPVSAQNTNMSLTVCRRGMVNSFFRSMFNSSSVRNARFVFVCLK